MLHERADGEPHGIDQRKVVDQNSGLLGARMRVVPLVRAKPEMKKKTMKIVEVLPRVVTLFQAKLEYFIQLLAFQNIRSAFFKLMVSLYNK